MRILAVDTTTFAGSVALLDKKRLLTEVNLESPFTHSEKLLPAIQFVLEVNRMEINDIDGFAVAVGPGSFTGIRIGLSTIKSLSYASGKPIAPVSTLKALALKLRYPQNRLISPLLDAKKGQIYASLFESKKRQLKELVPQGAYKPDQFFSFLPSHRVIHFIGNGVEAYKEKIFHYFKDKARLSPRALFIAYEIGVSGYDILREKKGVDYQKIEPLYFRKSQAEEKD